MKTIYLDNAAATPIEPRVLRAMNKAANLYGNPSSFNNTGRAARTEIEKARQTIAGFLGARADEIVFTSSGSEANNLAIQGTLNNSHGTVLTTAIEHKSVIEPLKKSGLKIVHIPVDGAGLVDLKSFKALLTVQCSLVSVMYANNEIGTIQPIQKIGKIIRDFRQKLETENCRKDLPKGEKLETHEKVGPLFHVDACQAAGFLDMDVRRLGVDLLTFDGCKIYGPHGIGVLYVRRGTPIQALIVGADQEQGLKAGTENIQNIVGLAQAVSLIKPSQAVAMTKIRDYTIQKLLAIPEVVLNGPLPSLKLRRASHQSDRLPNNINISVPGLTNELLLLELDRYGIAAGSGSACMSHSVEPSHVLKAIGVPAKYINGALRFSLGRDTTKKDIDYLVKSLIKIITDLTKRYARLR